MKTQKWMIILGLVGAVSVSAGEVREISRSDYAEKMQGFWLGQCIANWTGLRTEGVRKTQPFYTDKAWGTNQGLKDQKIEFVLVEEGAAWGADDDSDIVIMHSLASSMDTSLSMKEQTQWLAEQARKRLPNKSYPAMMYDWIKEDYEKNPDKENWETTRDALNLRHTGVTTDGYNYRSWFDAGINYGASLISLFYGEGDFKRTIQIGTLCGWDSDNPTATWGGLLGFMLGREGVEKQFPEKKLSGLYNISRTRVNFPDRTPNQKGDDTFELMAERGLEIIDRVVTEEMGGRVDTEKGAWSIPRIETPIEPAKYGS